MRDSTLAPVWFQMAQVFRRGWEHRGTQGLPCRGSPEYVRTAAPESNGYTTAPGGIRLQCPLASQCGPL